MMARVVVAALQQQSVARRTTLTRLRPTVLRVARGIAKQMTRSLGFQVDRGEEKMGAWKMTVYGAAGNLLRIRFQWVTWRQRRS
jgi:hypothetical protein